MTATTGNRRANNKKKQETIVTIESQRFKYQHRTALGRTIIRSVITIVALAIFKEQFSELITILKGFLVVFILFAVIFAVFVGFGIFKYFRDRRLENTLTELNAKNTRLILELEEKDRIIKRLEQRS
jgi:hypothetical protein